MTDWQDILTAPYVGAGSSSSGTDVLLVNVKGGAAWVGAPRIYEGDDGVSRIGTPFAMVGIRVATHWMALPALPTDGRQG